MAAPVYTRLRVERNQPNAHYRIRSMQWCVAKSCLRTSSQLPNSTLEPLQRSRLLDLDHSLILSRCSKRKRSGPRI